MEININWTKTTSRATKMITSRVDFGEQVLSSNMLQIYRDSVLIRLNLSTTITIARVATLMIALRTRTYQGSVERTTYSLVSI